MRLGALLILAALLLAIYNLAQEREGAASSDAALEALWAMIPESEDVKEAEIEVFISDRSGKAVDWPMDESGEPMIWQLDASGDPVAVLEDASGKTYYWQVMESEWSAEYWTVTADGLLPWISGTDGVTVQWPMNAFAEKSTIKEIRSNWSALIAQLGDTIRTAKPLFVRNPEKEMPVKTIEGRDYIGILEIPELSLSLPVMSEWSYPNLRKAPCRYEGSIYSGDLIIAGHNYSRHFGHLKDLEIGDTAIFTDVDGNVFTYALVQTEKLGAYANDLMRDGEWDMTLFTCTYGGQYRVTLRFALQGIQSAS